MKQLRWETENRFYCARVYKDMLDFWVVEKAWGGRQNNLGNIGQEVVPTYRDAIQTVLRIHKERRARKYDLVESR
ncbi:hypothetical protein AAKU58_004140 [Oxalobacteraceae bacterium GrIS 1.18]